MSLKQCHGKSIFEGLCEEQFGSISSCLILINSGDFRTRDSQEQLQID